MYKVTPPLRPEADRLALIAGIKDGTVDCITSHHRPQDWDAKEKEFEYAADGMNIQEIAFRVVWETIGEEIGLEKIVNLFALTPRTIFGVKADDIAIGNIAELTLFTTKGKTAVEEKTIRSASRNNPFIGKELRGKVIGIVSNTSLHINI
jgi:dihydroorotase